MGPTFQFQVLFQSKIQRWLFVMVVVAVTHLMFQSLLLPYGDALRSLLPSNEVSMGDPDSFFMIHSSTKSVTVQYPLAVNDSSSAKASINVGLVEEKDEKISAPEDIEDADDTQATSKEGDTSIASEDGFKLDIKLLGINADGVLPHKIVTEVPAKVIENNSTADKNGNSTDDVHLEQVVEGNIRIPTNTTHTTSSSLSLPIKHSEVVENSLHLDMLTSLTTESLSNVTYPNSLLSNGSRSYSLGAPKESHNASQIESLVTIAPVRKQMRCNMPPKSVTTIEEMNRLYLRRRASSRAMRPRWSSPRDQEILAAKVQIQNAPVIGGDKELYAPLFRNISQFKKSYELMEHMLKVYVYKDGKKPIFHQPIMKGLYASEGWFMKLMEGNRQFVVKDPRKAHLFYMPFSSRMLEYTLYVRNSHNRTNLLQYLKEYTDKISAKYPFFNRTGGADHFLVACHDWAPYETRHHMERCIKALCNADVTAGFKIGRDVSLPETYVRSQRNPLRDLGGKPPSNRHILAFYAGNLHGYLRPILLKHWKDKEPDMKIFGPMPPGVISKMNYIQHMKSSKYCICPKGYEVNSPRVVEAIFYECVPVIISDNFVPPFFGVLDWGSFSLILEEKDIPNLKSILLSIPEDKYREMQFRVRKVQRHFLWHAKPLKYDLFYMTLHSIWYNRVFQIKPR